MYGHDGGGWLWMTLGMSLGLIVLGVVVFLAVRLAARDRTGRSDR